VSSQTEDLSQDVISCVYLSVLLFRSESSY
jgi:hypothetical protein